MLAITEELGRFEELFSDVVYPVWPAWLTGIIAAAAVGAFVAYRLGWHHWALQHRFLTAGTLAIILAVGIPTAWYTVSPVFDRDTICEASPLAGAGSGSERCEGIVMAAGETTDSPTPSADAPTDTRDARAIATPETAAPTAAPALEPRVASQGEFQGADEFHFGRGQALLIETASSEYTLRFENFSVRNGPDLFVYLSTDPNGYSNDALLLGELKGTDGAFNYDVPGETDISHYKSVVVWCKAFSVLFATATLT